MSAPSIGRARWYWPSLLAAVLTGSTLLLNPSPTSAGASVSCEYTPSNHKVVITATGSGDVTVTRNARGRILANGSPCSPIATIANTDRIVILAGNGDQAVNIRIQHGGFKPGWTDEPGNSDEIEIAVSTGAGFDSLFILGDIGNDNIVYGKSSSGFAMGGVNLNAGESTGVDADVSLSVGIEQFQVWGYLGHDVISGAGGAGTGDGFQASLVMDGNAGNDTLTGGSAGDILWGDAGKDVLWGGPGPDQIGSNDGVAGNDTIQGGKGGDSCTYDPGDSVASC